MTDPTAEPSHKPVLNGVSSSGAVAPENRDVYRAEPNMIPTEYQRAKRPRMYAPATAEPSQHDQYREKIRQALALAATSGRLPVSREPLPLKSIADMILAVRDAEMEQLRADVEFAERYGRRAHTAWLSASRRAHEYRQAAAAEGDLADEAARERDAARAELAGLRERAVILPEDWRDQLANEVSGMWLDEVTALVESWRAAPEPATPPKRMLRAPQRIDPHAATIDPATACGRYEPRGELGGVVYTLCLNCGLGIAAHGSNPNGDTDA